jgi:hypothetical protein
LYERIFVQLDHFRAVACNCGHSLKFQMRLKHECNIKFYPQLQRFKIRIAKISSHVIKKWFDITLWQRMSPQKSLKLTKKHGRCWIVAIYFWLFIDSICTKRCASWLKWKKVILFDWFKIVFFHYSTSGIKWFHYSTSG